MKRSATILLILLIFLASCGNGKVSKCVVKIGTEKDVRFMNVDKIISVRAFNKEDNRQYGRKIILAGLTNETCTFTVDDDAVIISKNNSAVKYDVLIKVVGIE